MAPRFLPALLLAVMAMLAGCSTAPSTAPVLQVKTVPIDPTFAQMSVEDLIDRLQEETQFMVQDSPNSGHIETPALARGFPLIDAPLPGEENLKLGPPSPVMLELARRGVASLPALLKHLTDARPTKIVIRGPDMGGPVGFADYYDYRYSNPDEQPKGVNTVTRATARVLKAREPYPIKVGDLCYTAVGAIVNRRLVFYGGGLRESDGKASLAGSRALSSPVVFPKLAAAALADWSGLTAAQHERSLREDALRKDKKGFPDRLTTPWGASNSLQRLTFYYPATGRRLAETFLARRLVNDDAVSGKLGESEATCEMQRILVRDLGPFQWERLDRKIYLLYQTAVAQPAYTRAARSGRDLLAFQCAKRLVGQDPKQDDAFRKFFAERIAANSEGLSDSDESLEANELRRVNAQFREFLNAIPPVAHP